MPTLLPPTARLALMALKDTPNQTFARLLESTGTRNHNTLRDALRLLQVARLVGRSAERPWIYSLIEDEVSNG